MASPLIFEPQRAPSLARIVESHISFLNETFVFLFLHRFARHLNPLRGQLYTLRASFWGRDPAPTSVSPLTGSYWLESIKKDKAAQLRRYTLGAQARGLHAELRGACNEQDQLDLALRPPNPIVAAQTARIRTGVRFLAVA